MSPSMTTFNGGKESKTVGIEENLGEQKPKTDYLNWEYSEGVRTGNTSGVDFRSIGAKELSVIGKDRGEPLCKTFRKGFKKVSSKKVESKEVNKIVITTFYISMGLIGFFGTSLITSLFPYLFSLVNFLGGLGLGIISTIDLLWK